jgi:hypothetical protein
VINQSGIAALASEVIAEIRDLAGSEGPLPCVDYDVVSIVGVLANDPCCNLLHDLSPLSLDACMYVLYDIDAVHMRMYLSIYLCLCSVSAGDATRR